VIGNWAGVIDKRIQFQKVLFVRFKIKDGDVGNEFFVWNKGSIFKYANLAAITANIVSRFLSNNTKIKRNFRIVLSS